MQDHCACQCWDHRYVRVVHERGHFDFFDRFVRTDEVYSLVIVTPWIYFPPNESYMLDKIVTKISAASIPTTAVMRSPLREPMNAAAARALIAIPSVTLYYNNELHAKVYVCRCPPTGFALVGSANLSGRATHAHEIGLLIEGKGEGLPIVDELERVGTLDLPGRAGTTRALSDS